MFYSHEILSNSQYGVSTIWLVATVGKTANRRVTRKAIQEVNVPKACEKIIHPGAPLALRLQGNLLYGVSRVFAQQCHYVLSDAEKTQSDMLTFFRVMQTSELDPKAGKAKRHQITLQDDPSFDLASIFPKLDLFSSNKELVLLSSQNSTQSVSQMTPLSQGTISSRGNQPFLGFDLPQSSHSGGSYRLPSDLGRNSPFSKPFNPQDSMPEFNPFGGDDLDPIAGIGLNFDADGNLVEMLGPEPDLPLLPGTEAHNAQFFAPDTHMTRVQQGKGIDLFEGDNVIIMGEDELPDAEAFPRRPLAKKPNTLSLSSESSFSKQASAPLRKGRPRKTVQLIDRTDHVSREEFRNWSVNYLENMENCRKKPRPANKAQAHKNAIALLFDNGISNVGMLQGVPGFVHPLAQDFSGAALKARLQGRHPEQDDERGQIRSSSEAFEDEEVENRRVKQKSDEKNEVGRGPVDDLDPLILGDDSVPEIGMGDAPALDDHHSSSMIPWNRPQSAGPGSSIRGFGSAQKGHPAPSPLHARGSVVGSIERYSDLPGPAHGSDEFPQLHSQDSSLAYEGLDAQGGVNNIDTQGSTQGLDASSLEFFGYAESKAIYEGHARPGDDHDRRWVDFEKLADPAVHTKRIAAQAFLHVLSLATKNVIAVKQEGIAHQQPFGTLLIGVKPEQDDERDELA
ncbi:Rec8 like protein-domain-containing protein [Ilyonectria sp. MPI-CAGE-AT-0026]|nr:Rec8 like protein-domain-containing protein [Ilyonectria sp. MPI-CAGE-AT-0026]